MSTGVKMLQKGASSKGVTWRIEAFCMSNLRGELQTTKMGRISLLEEQVCQFMSSWVQKSIGEILP